MADTKTSSSASGLAGASNGKKAHTVATTSFDANHALYDQVRPGYIAEAVDWLTERLGLSDGSTVVDLAAGTGKFTAAIADKGYNIIAVEPSAGMLQTFTKNFPGFHAVQGDSYHIPLENGVADAVIIAQAFHWFADHDSLKEIHRVLRPGGSLGIIWNYDDVASLPQDSWQRAITELIWTHDGNVPQYRHNKWPAAFNDQNYFRTPLNEERFSFVRRLPNDPEAVWNYWQSRSYITALTNEERDSLHDRVVALYHKLVKPEHVIDGQINSRHGVHIVWTSRID